MSIPALVWIDSIQIGNAHAKSLLRYLATHNFSGHSFFFKNSTYTKALEISEKTLQRSFALLEAQGRIKIERRFDEFGRQVSNQIDLIVPKEFLENYQKMIEDGKNYVKNDSPIGGGDNVDNSVGGGRQTGDPRGDTLTGGGRHTDAPYNNNINNKSNNNKLEQVSRKKRATLSFIPNSENQNLAFGLKLNIADEVKSFEERYKREKTQYAFSRWLKNASEYHSRKKSVQPQHEIRSTVQEWAPGHPSYDAIHNTKRTETGQRKAM